MTGVFDYMANLIILYGLSYISEFLNVFFFIFIWILVSCDDVYVSLVFHVNKLIGICLAAFMPVFIQTLSFWNKMCNCGADNKIINVRWNPVAVLCLVLKTLSRSYKFCHLFLKWFSLLVFLHVCRGLRLNCLSYKKTWLTLMELGIVQDVPVS